MKVETGYYRYVILRGDGPAVPLLIARDSSFPKAM